MLHIKPRWGLVPFLFAPILSGAALFIAINYPLNSHGRVYTQALPVMGLIFTLTSFFIGHFSYPRVHNLKVYLIGYVTGIIGLGFFLLFRFPVHFPIRPVPTGYLTALYLFIFINILAIESAPSFVKYRTAKNIVLTLLPIEGILLLIARFSPNATQWTGVFCFNELLSPAVLSGVLFFLLAILVGLLRTQNEFYLGGIFAGLAFFYTFSWISRVYFPSFNTIEAMIFVAAPFYLEVCIFIHWFIRLEHRIAYDPLLHIYNRDYCSRIISEQSNLNLLPPLGVVMVDIDFFKSVNDTYGHHAGDLVLYAVAQAICREVVPDGVVCRYGGEELIIFFPQKSIAQVMPIVEKVRRVIERTKTKTERKFVHVTVSSGVSCREEIEQSIIDVIKAADKALYKAKESGRNRVKACRTASMALKKKE